MRGGSEREIRGHRWILERRYWRETDDVNDDDGHSNLFIFYRWFVFREIFFQESVMDERWIECPVEECDRRVKWKDASNMKKHLPSVHAWTTEEVKDWNEKRLGRLEKDQKEVFTCEFCPVTCGTLRALKKHRSRHEVSLSLLSFSLPSDSRVCSDGYGRHEYGRDDYGR